MNLSRFNLHIGRKRNMMTGFTMLAFLLLVLDIWVGGPAATAASSGPLMKAKMEAGDRGFIFESSHDDIVAKAKKERKLRVLSTADAAVLSRTVNLYKRKYSFLDVEAQEVSGSEAQQRFLMELQAGTATNVDVAQASEDYYENFQPHLKKFDILGMAEQRVLAIEPRMVDPNNRSVVSVASTLYCVAYNKKLLSPDKVPNTWEDFLKPGFKGKKFLTDIRPFGMSALIPLMGEDWVKDFAKKIAAQEPVWVRGQSRSFVSIAAGEYPLSMLAYWHSCMEAAAKDPTRSLECKIISPAPARLANADFVIKTAPSPYSGLLWLETEASPEGQKIYDDIYPLKSSLYAQGKTAEVLKGHKVSVIDFKNLQKLRQWMDMIVSAYGFPKEQK